MSVYEIKSAVQLYRNETRENTTTIIRNIAIFVILSLRYDIKNFIYFTTYPNPFLVVIKSSNPIVSSFFLSLAIFTVKVFSSI